MTVSNDYNDKTWNMFQAMAEDSFGQKLSDASQVWWLVVELVGGLWGIYSKLHQCAQSAASLESGPLGFGGGLGVVSIVLSLMKLGTALEYFWWQLTHFLK